MIGIDGTDGALSSLSACAEITSGSVNILHPLGMHIISFCLVGSIYFHSELVRQIRQLTQNPVIATNVNLSAIVHPNLAFDRVDSPQGLSRIVKGTERK